MLSVRNGMAEFLAGITKTIWRMLMPYKSEAYDLEKLSPEEYRSYNRLQAVIVLLDNLFCIIFVLCITFLAYNLNKWSLMWFYLLPVVAFVSV